MGLFSFRKSEPQKSSIPDDILADVNVNGEKKQSPSSPASFPPPAASTPGTSPFLKSKPAPAEPIAFPKEDEKREEVSSQPSGTLNGSNSQEKPASVPKPFHFADQAPLPGAIHFTDVPASKKPENEEQAVPRPDFSQITQDKALTEKQLEHLKPMKVSSPPLENEKKGFRSTSTLLSVGVFVLILLFIAGGSWYYLNTRNTPEELPDMSIGAMGQAPVAPAPQEKGSLLIDQPNYLKLDIETIGLSDIKKLLEGEAEKMATEGITAPIEYLAVDMNGNPVAFSRFALLIEADAPKDLVEASLEPFSLYLYLDGGAPRMTLAIPLKAEAGANFPSQRSVVPESLKKFFYPEELQSTTFDSADFRQSSYQNNMIFYTNIDESKNWSFDMSLQEGVLSVSNSKNALRAVIDKRSLPAQ